MLSFLRSKAAPPSAPSIAPEPSLLAEYVLFPFYDFIVKYYPRSWTPNKVTLFGVFMTLLSSILVFTALPAGLVFTPSYPSYFPYAWFAPWCSGSEGNIDSDTNVLFKYNIIHMIVNKLFHGNSNVAVDNTATTRMITYPDNIYPYFSSIFTPATMFLFCGLCNLIYCVADNTDGRLARRDKKTSGIGEYLDHGLDCVTSLLSTCVTCLIFSASTANMSMTVVLIGIVTVFSHTLHYEKNIFIWGNRFVSVDEAMIMFGVQLWAIVFWPSIGSVHVFSKWNLAPYVGNTVVRYMNCMNFADCLYVTVILAQMQTIANITLRNIKMLFRLHVWCAITHCLIMLCLLPIQNQYVISMQSATSIVGYTIGPLNYVAVWSITMATTLSIITHIPIATRCAHKPVVSWTPLLGVMLIWCSFATFPVLGLAAAVCLHLMQILYNVQFIQCEYEKRQVEQKQKLLVNGNGTHFKNTNSKKKKNNSNNNNSNNNNKKKNNNKAENGGSNGAKHNANGNNNSSNGNNKKVKEQQNGHVNSDASHVNGNGSAKVHNGKSNVNGKDHSKQNGANTNGHYSQNGNGNVNGKSTNGTNTKGQNGHSSETELEEKLVKRK